MSRRCRNVCLAYRPILQLERTGGHVDCALTLLRSPEYNNDVDDVDSVGGYLTKYEFFPSPTHYAVSDVNERVVSIEACIPQLYSLDSLLYALAVPTVPSMLCPAMNSLFTHVPTYLCIHLYQQDKRQRLETFEHRYNMCRLLWQHATGNRVGCRIQVMAGCGTRCTSEKRDQIVGTVSP
jgi:hypothetical protein